MGMFVDPATLPEGGDGLLQVCFLGAVYGFVLYYASNMISDGSELLLLVPSLAGLVGSVVLPVLGAVPDGAIVLFSGMGPDAQEQISVGVGALAGSTIMLITIPWCVAIYAGRVNLNDKGNGNYNRPKQAAENWTKLQPPGNKSLKRTGVVFFDEISTNAKMAMATGLIYLILQLPAFKYTGTKARDAEEDPDKVAAQEKPFALAAFIVAIISFLAYLYYNVHKSSQVSSDKVDEVRVQAIRNGKISLSGVLSKELSKMKERSEDETTALTARAHLEQVKHIVRPFFFVYDEDHNGKIDSNELQSLFKDLGESLKDDEAKQWLKSADVDNSGYLELDELVQVTLRYLLAKYEKELSGKSSDNVRMGSIHREPVNESSFVSVNEEEDEEEEDVPEDLANLSVAEQQKRIKLRAAWMTLVGTALVLVFSDPMVDILSEVGKRTGVPSFYISFIFAPLASNASEIIASYNYALKKTSKTISISVSALLGAVIMNNTLNVGIFAGLMYFKSSALVWEFTAEVAAILFAEVAVGLMALRKTQRLVDALVVLSVYPASLVIVYVLENVFGLD